ncbi:MAG: xanthine dehydrogenase accessory factor [Frankiales bacterium]|nr:xanthine dehydrogenase accessory factor [Frankiales bacterium]
MPTSMTERVRELRAHRVPLVQATVVRAQSPSSAHTGDVAIILSDGTMEGFVGGVCAEASVRTAALDALTSKDSVLLRVLPEGDEAFPELSGAQVVVNPCLSGGALEIFLQPLLPPPLVQIVGHTPVADAVAALCDVLGYTTTRSLPGTVTQGAAATVVASLGRDEHQSIRAALDADVGYIALVASKRRGQAVLDEVAVTDSERDRISTPAGLDIGAETAAEVALSIMAEVVAALRSTSVAPVVAGQQAVPQQALDPVCGMTVVVMPDTPHLHAAGEQLWFCSSSCRDRYAEKVEHR